MPSVLLCGSCWAAHKEKLAQSLLYLILYMTVASSGQPLLVESAGACNHPSMHTAAASMCHATCW